ncbi:MAG: LytR/AlgR family response regulator transcription factor [Saprospiraceae bacterium]
MNITTILVEDEPLAIMELKAMLQKHPEIQVVAEAGDMPTAIQQIQRWQPQLLFLDINLPGKSGFDLLEALDEAPQVVFVTAYDQYAIKAFEYNALDYLLKPVNANRLADVINKIKKLLQPKNEQDNERWLSLDKRIFIKDGEQCYFVMLADIYLIESVGNYAQVFFQNKSPLLHKSLNYLEEKLPRDYFFRANRQQIINVNFIKNIIPFFNNTLQVELQSGQKVDISQRQSVKFKETMGI